MDSLRRGKERKGKENGRETWYWGGGVSPFSFLFLLFSCRLDGGLVISGLASSPPP